MSPGQVIGQWRRRVLRPVNLGAAILVVAAAALLAYLISLFIDTNEAVRTQMSAAREDMVWATYQLEREANDLAFVLRDEAVTGDARITAMTKHYDILYSRTGVVTAGQLGKRFSDNPKLVSLITTITSDIKDLAPTFDFLVAKRELTRPTLLHIKAAIDKVRDDAAQLIIATNAAHNDIKVADRAELKDDYNKIAWTALGLGAVIMAVMGMMVFQLMQIRRLSIQHSRAAEEAQAASRAKSAFLAAMSHEIRTPLNGIIGMTELLGGSEMSTDQRSQIGVIRHSGDVLLDIINDILDFSKLESGSIELEKAPVKVDELVNVIGEMMAPRAGQKGLVFDVSATPAVIETDAARLRQVLINLVGNAIKFTEKGRVSLNAQVRTSETGISQLSIVVTDTGIGMSSETQTQLFNEFMQADASISRRFGGTGLGLAICKRIVSAFGGDIRVESRPGEGSRFTVTIPCRLAAAPAAQEAPASAPVMAGLRVLLVEDNPINQQVAQGLLERMGQQVTIAENGAVALDWLARARFDLVLMDMQMPVMDGLTATREIRARGDATPIVGLTANAFASDRDACLAAGMDLFVSKPVTRAKLEDALREVVPAGAMTEAAPRTATADAPAAPLTDVAQQQALIAELGQEVFEALMDDFGTESETLLREAGNAPEQEVRVRALHTLKGMARTLGLVAIGDEANRAEMAMKETGMADLTKLAMLVALPPERQAA